MIVVCVATASVGMSCRRRCFVCRSSLGRRRVYHFVASKLRSILRRTRRSHEKDLSVRVCVCVVNEELASYFYLVDNERSICENTEILL